MYKRVLLFTVLAALLISLPLLAQEQLITKLYFDSLLRDTTNPLETKTNELKSRFAQMEQELKALKRQLVTEIKVKIGSKEAAVDGNTTFLDVAPVLKNGRTMVPVRFIGEAFGADFAWDEKTRRVTYILEDLTIELYIGKKNAAVNGKSASLEAEPVIVDGRTMVPLRFVGQYMGATFDWDGQMQMATIYR